MNIYYKIKLTNPRKEKSEVFSPFNLSKTIDIASNLNMEFDETSIYICNNNIFDGYKEKEIVQFKRNLYYYFE